MAWFGIQGKDSKPEQHEVSWFPWANGGFRGPGTKAGGESTVVRSVMMSSSGLQGSP